MKLPINYSDFTKTLEFGCPIQEWPKGLKAIWYDAKGDWNAAHEIADAMTDGIGLWIHAYLHRKEGDEWNAGYWYRQAGRSLPKISLEQEQGEIVEFILKNQ